MRFLEARCTAGLFLGRLRLDLFTTVAGFPRIGYLALRQRLLTALPKTTTIPRRSSAAQPCEGRGRHIRINGGSAVLDVCC